MDQQQQQQRNDQPVSRPLARPGYYYQPIRPHRPWRARGGRGGRGRGGRGRGRGRGRRPWHHSSNEHNASRQWSSSSYNNVIREGCTFFKDSFVEDPWLPLLSATNEAEEDDDDEIDHPVTSNRSSHTDSQIRMRDDMDQSVNITLQTVISASQSNSSVHARSGSVSDAPEAATVQQDAEHIR